jgi:hypothetical protein
MITCPQTDSRSAWINLTVGVGLLAVLKGVRLPSLWSATQLQVDYSLGFVKRAAAGAALHQLGVPIGRYWVFVGFSFVVLSLAVILFALFVRQRSASQEVSFYSPIFLSSFAVTYFVHLVGYLDILLLTLVLFIMVIPRNASSVAVTYVICAAGILIHEAFLLSFFPIVWFRLLLDSILSPGPGRRVAVLHAVALPLLLLIETVFIALPQPMTSEKVSQMQTAISASVDFSVCGDYFDSMGHSTLENIRIMAARFRTPHWWIKEIGASLSLLWIALYFVWQSIRLTAASGTPHKTLLVTAVLCVSLCPTLLQLLAWDLFRWYATAAFAAFMAYLLLAERMIASEQMPSSIVNTKTLALFLIGLNLSTGAGLLDGYQVNTFPFIDGVIGWERAYRTFGHIPVPAIPPWSRCRTS